MLIMSATGGLFGGFFGALYIAYILRGLQLGPMLLGFGIACGGIGALTGSLAALRVGRWLGVGPAICICSALSPLSILLILVPPPGEAGHMAALMVSQFFGDFFGVIPLILSASLRQTLLPHSVLGRVGATFRASHGGTAVLGALAGGLLGEAFGMRAAMLLAVGGLLVGPVIGALSPLWRVRAMPDEEA